MKIPQGDIFNKPYPDFDTLEKDNVDSFVCDPLLSITKTGFVYSGSVGGSTGLFGDYVEYTVTVKNDAQYFRYDGLKVQDLLPT